MNATGPERPNPALMAALTTEHYTLQSARTSTIVEANGSEHGDCPALVDSRGWWFRPRVRPG